MTKEEKKIVTGTTDVDFCRSRYLCFIILIFILILIVVLLEWFIRIKDRRTLRIERGLNFSGLELNKKQRGLFPAHKHPRLFSIHRRRRKGGEINQLRHRKRKALEWRGRIVENVNVSRLGLDEVGFQIFIVMGGGAAYEWREGGRRRHACCGGKRGHGPESIAGGSVEGVQLAIDGSDEDDVE